MKIAHKVASAISGKVYAVNYYDATDKHHAR